MKILIIDTCGEIGSVALVDTSISPKVVTSATLPGRTASELLLVTIRELAADLQIALDSLDAVTVVHGPGSFTGVRVGLSAAKGLCEALNLPLIAVSRLAVLAGLAGAKPGELVRTLLDAGRGDFYLGEYRDGEYLREALLTRDELFALEVPDAETADPSTVTVCEPAVALSLVTLSPQLVAPPTAEDALALAEQRLRSRAFDDVATLDANYLRRTAAEIFAKPSTKAAPASQFSAQQVGTPTP